MYKILEQNPYQDIYEFRNGMIVTVEKFEFLNINGGCPIVKTTDENSKLYATDLRILTQDVKSIIISNYDTYNIIISKNTVISGNKVVLSSNNGKLRGFKYHRSNNILYDKTDKEAEEAIRKLVRNYKSGSED